ncbi:MAG: S-adenosylmethionine decarboxylase [Candidatus Diapherotrites archaeon]|nr:S-adenosylmethionine decarboxylase [Candidatus Diapherotrites archaeon]
MKDGHHLTVDLKECRNLSGLSDEKFIENTLVDLVKIVKMKAITKPCVLYYEHGDREESGVTGFVIISDSHVSVHTYPFKGSLYFDLFSCRGFDSKEVAGYLKEAFEPEKLTEKLLKR